MLYGTFPEEISAWTIAHVITVGLLSTLAGSCLDTVNFSMIFQICDKRVAGVYLTLLATMSNLSMFVHKLYIFTAVEYLGLFKSQAIVSLVAFVVALKLRKRLCALDDVGKEKWAVSDSVLHRVKTD